MFVAKLPARFTATTSLLLAAACSPLQTPPGPAVTCTPDWYHQVENILVSGDAQGHGPDPGSLEWRSVIEFRLGLRDRPGRPPLDSAHWCADIDRHLQKRL